MSKVIVLDVDDTIIYWSAPFIKWLFENKMNLIDTHRTETWFTLENVNEYNSTSNFSFRPKIQSVCDILDRFVNRSGADVVFISACGRDRYINQFRAVQICFFNFPWVLHTVDKSEDKLELLLNLQKQYDDILFIDDKQNTIDLALQNGIPSILPNSLGSSFMISSFLREDDNIGI